MAGMAFADLIEEVPRLRQAEAFPFQEVRRITEVALEAVIDLGNYGQAKQKSGGNGDECREKFRMVRGQEHIVEKCIDVRCDNGKRFKIRGKSYAEYQCVMIPIKWLLEQRKIDRRRSPAQSHVCFCLPVEWLYKVFLLLLALALIYGAAVISPHLIKWLQEMIRIHGDKILDLIRRGLITPPPIPIASAGPVHINTGATLSRRKNRADPS